MTAGRTVVVGTAGHVDHGKSALVEALTGTHPDRLKEERERGITIDLGFAHMAPSAPGEGPLSFVDVPGHERFVRNMLAGAAGIDVVLMVVAADESVMPQTREHLDICRLLGVGAGVLALTKSDLVDDETLDLVRLEVAELVEGTFLEHAPVVPCSAVTRAGLDDLVVELRKAAAVAPSRSTTRPARLPVDRVFTLKGFGTVVTGALAAGTLTAGEEVELLPSGRRARVRNVQVHGDTAQQASAGQRAALNLGGVDHHDLERGEVVVAPGSHVASSMLDVAVTLLPDAPDADDLVRVRLHLGTAEVMARVRWAGGVAPPAGGTALAQLRLETPVAAAAGDRFVLRRYSPVVTIGGGRVIHPKPPRKLRRRDDVSDLRAAAAAVEAGDHASLLACFVEQAGSAAPSEQELAALAGAFAADVRALLAPVVAAGRIAPLGTSPERWIGVERLSQSERELVSKLERFHAAEPLQPGAPKQALASGSDLPEAVFSALLQRLADAGRVKVTRDLVALGTHSITLTGEERSALDALVETHRASGLQPPDLEPLLEGMRLPREKAIRLVRLVLASGRLVRLKEGMLVHSDAMAGLVTDMASWYRPGEAFTVPDFKDRSRVSRKHAIPLLEHLDGLGFTRRAGDGRVWTGRGSPAAPPEPPPPGTEQALP